MTVKKYKVHYCTLYLIVLCRLKNIIIYDLFIDNYGKKCTA